MRQRQGTRLINSGRTTDIKDGTQWWYQYEGQEAVVIDDFDKKWPFRDLLRPLDRYPNQGSSTAHAPNPVRQLSIMAKLRRRVHYTRKEDELAKQQQLEVLPEHVTDMYKG